jgi:O-glycosyl hydrolase
MFARPALISAATLAANESGEPFHISTSQRQVHVWGRGAEAPRAYFDEFLPALFERTLAFETVELAGGALEWIFTGERGGVTVRVDEGSVRVTQRFYDSFGFNDLDGDRVRAARHPERRWVESIAEFEGPLTTLTVALDHRLGLSVSINGAPRLRQECLLDLSRHQLRLAGKNSEARGRLRKPGAVATVVRLHPGQTCQTIFGFGGIATPTAYHQLSAEGKRLWWEIVCEYNLLVQREYPIGTRLDADMDNWDVLADATPHYYGDNFPNGEISDFDYLKTLRGLGGKVLFEFWQLPPWARRDWKDSGGKLHRGVADPGPYTRAILEYCRTSRKQAGAPPDVVGIQNERNQPPEVWHEMTLSLRRALDDNGFKNVRIHMSDSGRLAGGIERAKAFRQSPRAWAAIDYAATHMYDYQNRFIDPDAYDALLRQWAQLTGDKPFLSTELCVNSSRYQWPSYRLAFQMGQLYHKNFVISNASAVLYCWTLLNVVQPSYGWTRTLLVPDRAHGFMPSASSHQLRVYGAYSRRVREAMVRIEAASSSDGLLACAFAGEKGARTVILLNRATAPLRVRVEGADATFDEMEIVSPYQQNRVKAAPKPLDGGATAVVVDPGAIVTLTNVPLGRLPEK